MDKYNFTQDWFSDHIPIWESVLEIFQFSNVLEIGSYEGRSACWIIEAIGKKRDLNITCIDIWSNPTNSIDPPEKKFDENIKIAIESTPSKVHLQKMKGDSISNLAKLINSNKYFDFIYIDGSHNGPEVLSDLVFSFRALKLGGIMICDDYLWKDPKFGGNDFLSRPKMAIDSFTSIFNKKIEVLAAPTNQQVYIQKIA
jgi:predicted O-methyltransferase YrrM